MPFNIRWQAGLLPLPSSPKRTASKYASPTADRAFPKPTGRASSTGSCGSTRLAAAPAPDWDCRLRNGLRRSTAARSLSKPPGRAAARSARDCGCPPTPSSSAAMSEFLAPGVYIEEVAFDAHSIEGVSTSTAGFIGAADGPRLFSEITSFKASHNAASCSSLYLSSAVRGFFDNGGQRCSVVLIAATDPVEDAPEALSGEPVSILCCPDENFFPTPATVMAEDCERRKDRFCILQSPQPTVPIRRTSRPVRSSYAAYYHPWLIV